MSMIAVSGLNMAAWDALAKAANLPLAIFLGGSLGSVPAYNSNDLWLIDVAKLADEAVELAAESGFTGLKLRLGRDRLKDDLNAIEAVRAALGAEVKLMVDFNQGLSLGYALHRCHALDRESLFWFEEPITYNNLAGYTQLARELATRDANCLGAPSAVSSFDFRSTLRLLGSICRPGCAGQDATSTTVRD
jgi:mandelate racemase